MKIERIEGTDSDILKYRIEDMLGNSRFTATVEHRPRNTLAIVNVRLNLKKDYCGNHPKACEPRAGKHNHKKGAWLEGADWVEFNDLLNDVLDSLDAEAYIHSSVVIVRKGALRRVEYDATTQFSNRTWAWDKDGPEDHYADWRGGVAPSSTFPNGTPGIYTRNRVEYFCVGAH